MLVPRRQDAQHPPDITRAPHDRVPIGVDHQQSPGRAQHARRLCVAAVERRQGAAENVVEPAVLVRPLERDEVDRLLRGGHGVRALISERPGAEKELPGADARMDVRRADVRKPESLRGAFDGVDVVIHTVAIPTERKQRFAEVNVAGVAHVVAPRLGRLGFRVHRVAADDRELDRLRAIPAVGAFLAATRN